MMKHKSGLWNDGAQESFVKWWGFDLGPNVQRQGFYEVDLLKHVLSCIGSTLLITRCMVSKVFNFNV